MEIINCGAGITHTRTHTIRVVEHSHRNDMKAADLAIVFGPTIMRAEHVSLAIVTLMPVQNGIVDFLLVAFFKSKSYNFVWSVAFCDVISIYGL